MFEHEVVYLVLLCGIRGRRVETVNLDGTVVACGCEVLVRGVECDTLDMTLVIRERLELLKRVS